MNFFSYIFLLTIISHVYGNSNSVALCAKDSAGCNEPADDGGDLFEFVKRAHKAGQQLDQRALQDYLSLGKHDQHRMQALDIASKINSKDGNEMSAWIQKAKSVLSAKNPNAIAMLNTLKILTTAGNKFLGISEAHEKLGKELQQAKSAVTQVNSQLPNALLARYDLASQAHLYSKSAQVSSEWIFDHLSNYVDDQTLRDLGTFQINNATDLKRFYQVVRDRKVSNKHALIALNNHEVAVKEWQSRVEQLQNDSPWYEEELADLQTQYLLIKQLRN